MFKLLLPFLIDAPAAPPAEPPAFEGAPPAEPPATPPAEPPKPGVMGQALEGQPPAEPPKHPAEGQPPAEPPKPGERPEFLPEQFWDTEKKTPKLEEMSKSYNEIRKAHNQLLNDGPGKPLEKAEDYLKDFTPPTKGIPEKEGEEGPDLDRFGDLKSDDPAFKAVAAGAKAANLSKEQFDKFMPAVMQAMNGYLPEPLDVEKEMAKLGDNGPTMVKTNVDWANALKNNGVINEDEHDLLFQFGSTSLGVQLCDKLRVNSGEKPIPLTPSVNTGVKTPDECRAMQADPRYTEDGPAGDAYRAEVDYEFKRTFGE